MEKESISRLFFAFSEIICIFAVYRQDASLPKKLTRQAPMSATLLADNPQKPQPTTHNQRPITHNKKTITHNPQNEYLLYRSHAG